MPIAGNSIYSVQLAYRNGVLSEWGFMHRSASIVEQDVERAVARLRAGETISMNVFGNNIPRIREEILGEVDA